MPTIFSVLNYLPLILTVTLKLITNIFSSDALFRYVCVLIVKLFELLIIKIRSLLLKLFYCCYLKCSLEWIVIIAKIKIIFINWRSLG